MRTLNGVVGMAAVVGLLVLLGPAAAQLVEKKQEKDLKTQTVKGTLQTVASSKLTVAADGKKHVDLQIDAGTKIDVDGKRAALTDLRKGQSVTCTYVTREGANVCLSVAARSAKD
jgi:hypothetical protein